ncbi:MAG TPA: hypothetical protein VG942_19395 [Hyphomonadaceae bacterium]|nr:hypothetical protein [Hyphomonadaceae bacterium]
MRSSLLLMLAAVALGEGAACADPATLFGGAAPGKSIQEIMSATPKVRWRTFNTQSGVLVGAVGEDIAQFAGDSWNLRLGKTSNYEREEPPYSFELSASHLFDTPQQCDDLLKRAIAAVEPEMGAYAPGKLSDIAVALTSSETRGTPPSEIALGAQSRFSAYDRGDTRYLVGAKDVAMGAATRASIDAIITTQTFHPIPNPLMKHPPETATNYYCVVAIHFSGPAQPEVK